MMSATYEHWAPQSEAFNFVSFASDRAYREANRALVDRAFAHLPSPFYHVDVATGTGLVPQEVCALCQERGKCGTIIGIDPDRFALESARKHTRPAPGCTVEFVQGIAQDMDRLLAGKVPSEGVDYVSIHDAIHEIKGEDDKRQALAAMGRILRPGGLFTYNSAFTTAAMEQAALEWGRLKAKAFAVLGGKRDRQIVALKIHTPEEYVRMIVDAGLSVVHEARHVVKISRAAMEGIARYPAFIEGVFADMIGRERVSLEEKSRALLEAIETLGLADLPRVWHEVVAQKVG
ncbi:MAG: class I SAM-dependent methyltransferase [Anaerolineae bacterium]|nr:class I SAM-dependent methyltransferase [Anaerolineae bacterium]